MTSSALTLFRPQDAPSKPVAALGLTAIYGSYRPSFGALAAELLYRILLSILERLYFAFERAFVSRFEAFMQRLDEAKTAQPESKILQQLAEQRATSHPVTDELERQALSGSVATKSRESKSSAKLPCGAPTSAFKWSWWDDRAEAGPPFWIVKAWEKRNAQ